jgi:hypothetical protein
VADRYEGVYANLVNGEIRYIGECENLSSRYNTGYGTISPRNCYEGGQSTNCKINRLVLEAVENGDEVSLWFRRTDRRKAVESELIGRIRPPWNGKR